MNIAHTISLAIGSMAKAARLVEVQQPQKHSGIFDIGALPWKQLKAEKAARDPGKVTLVVTHVTDADDGFTLAPYQIAAAKRMIKAGTVPYPIAEQIVAASLSIFEPDPAEVPGQFLDLDREEVARRLALWIRYRDTPYHMIAAPNGDAIRNRALEQHSYHAGPIGNKGFGFAVDCGHNEVLTDSLIATGRTALYDLFQRAVLAGAHDRRIVVIPHRALAGDRAPDPNAAVWRSIVKPTVALAQGRGHKIAIDYEFRAGTGKPVPTTWDDDAHYDERGRKVVPR